MEAIDNLMGSATLGNMNDALLDLTGEYGKSVKRTKSLRIKARIFMENNMVETYPALIDETETLMYVPQLQRIWMYPKTYYEDGKRTAYASARWHHCIKLQDVSEIADAQKYEFLGRIKYLRKWVTLKIDDVKGCIDMNVFDNMASSDFTIDSNKIIRTKALEFLQEVPKRKLMMYCLVSGLCGIILGAMMLGIGEMTFMYLFM